MQKSTPLYRAQPTAKAALALSPFYQAAGAGDHGHVASISARGDSYGGLRIGTRLAS